MPVRSLRSSVLKWPDAATVDAAVRRWAREQVGSRRDIRRIGYFGSYARGDWGVGSDLDLVIVLDRCEVPFRRRNLTWDFSTFPVPVEAIVYTEEEWQALAESRFGRVLRDETVWVFTVR